MPVSEYDGLDVAGPAPKPPQRRQQRLPRGGHARVDDRQLTVVLDEIPVRVGILDPVHARGDVRVKHRDQRSAAWLMPTSCPDAGAGSEHACCAIRAGSSTAWLTSRSIDMATAGRSGKRARSRRSRSSRRGKRQSLPHPRRSLRAIPSSAAASLRPACRRPPPVGRSGSRSEDRAYAAVLLVLEHRVAARRLLERHAMRHEERGIESPFWTCSSIRGI